MHISSRTCNSLEVCPFIERANLNYPLFRHFRLVLTGTYWYLSNGRSKRMKYVVYRGPIDWPVAFKV
jgi:hypothetical protein